jgi:hypothetical protein
MENFNQKRKKKLDTGDLIAAISFFLMAVLGIIMIGLSYMKGGVE